MALPGIANVLGVGAALFFRLSDPRRKKDILLDKKEKILKGPPLTASDSQKLVTIENEIKKLDREIERRV